MNSRFSKALVIAAVLTISAALLAVLLGNPGVTGGWSKLVPLSLFSTPKPPEGQVAGILYSEDRPIAVIGTQSVHEGDVVHGAKIVKIYKHKVEFEKDGQTWTQLLYENPAEHWGFPDQATAPNKNSLPE